MQDVSALAALVIAVIALVVAAGQLTQQVMATAYVLRKCDRIVTGGLTKGGTRQWHWRQFRFTVNYQSIVFALPASIYTALGISPTIQIDKPSKDIWTKAIRLRDDRTSAQGCWISFVQDLVMSRCLRPEDITLREESGDRIPEDLTVAPVRVDTTSVMLTCIAMGMQVFMYAPNTGEIELAGGIGGISSSNHPILGCLLHYTNFSDEPSIGFEAARNHGHALRQEKGVWANAVFGRFMDRSYSSAFSKFMPLVLRKMPILKSHEWPEESSNDSIGGAACFMAFAHVDVYEAVPPSVARSMCAHFAEVIVKAHHVEIARKGLEPKGTFTVSHEDCQRRQVFVDRYGCSSPHLPWEDLNKRTANSPDKPKSDSLPDIKYQTVNADHGPSADTDDIRFLKVQTETIGLGPPVDAELLRSTESHDVLASEDMIMGLASRWPRPLESAANLAFGISDPSGYVPMATGWETILRADQCMRHVYLGCLGGQSSEFLTIVEQVVAIAISSLSEVGAPSWQTGFQAIDTFWSEIFPASCNKVLNARSESANKSERDLRYGHWIPIYARLSILRAAYYTIMMRAARELGPGLTEEGRISTALAYMA